MNLILNITFGILFLTFLLLSFKSSILCFLILFCLMLLYDILIGAAKLFFEIKFLTDTRLFELEIFELLFDKLFWKILFLCC